MKKFNLDTPVLDFIPPTIAQRPKKVAKKPRPKRVTTYELVEEGLNANHFD